MHLLRLPAVLFVLWTLIPSLAVAWTLDREASVFAVLTHKEGLAAGLAHEHFVVAGAYDADLVVDHERLVVSSFEVRVAVEDLVVDDPARASRWQERLLASKLIEEPFADLSEKDRAKIRKSMLGKKQLDAEGHPSLRARLDNVRPADGDRHVATLSLTVRDRTARRDVEFQLPESGDPLNVEVVATFEFTEFGIEPYSALLGAIRVANTFHVFAVLVAQPSPVG